MAKVALITGSAVRIGREISHHLAIQGWNLALHYNSSSSEVTDFATLLQKNFPDQHFYIFKADLGDISQSSLLINRVIDQFGTLDLLINNASVFEASTLKKTTNDLFKQQTVVNYMTPFVLIRDFANKSNTGQVINMVDTRISNNKYDFFAYSLSKKVLTELTKMAALELAPKFRINAIAPGAAIAPVGKDNAYLEKIALNTPMKVPSGINPILKTIDYIIDNQDLTGQIIYCDGGSHLE